jgi:hypothetical protein
VSKHVGWLYVFKVQSRNRPSLEDDFNDSMNLVLFVSNSKAFCEVACEGFRWLVFLQTIYSHLTCKSNNTIQLSTVHLLPKLTLTRPFLWSCSWANPYRYLIFKDRTLERPWLLIFVVWKQQFQRFVILRRLTKSFLTNMYATWAFDKQIDFFFI